MKGKRVVSILCTAVIGLSSLLPVTALAGETEAATESAASGESTSEALPVGMSFYDEVPDQSDSNRKVVIAGPQDPGNYLPFNATNSVRDTYACYFYEHLFELYTPNELTPVIAESYTQVSDTVFDVKLHEGVTDSEGNAITAEDVAFCYNTAKANGEKENVFGDLEKVEAKDDLTAEFIFSKYKLGDFESVVTVQQPIVSQKAYEASSTGFSSDPVGTGPYVIKEWLPGSSLTLVRNDNYWAKDLGYHNQNVAEIDIKFIAEAAQVAIGLENGDIDFAYNVTTKDVLNFKDSGEFTVMDQPFTQVRAIGFNCDENNVFADERVRQAVCYAIDPNGILMSVYDGLGGVTSSMAVPEPEAGFVSDYDQAWKDIDAYPYDPEKAKELLKEAGYENGLTINLMSKDNAEYKSTDEVIQAYLAEVGITVQINAYENALYQTYRFQSDKYDMYLCGISNNNVPYLPVGWKWYLQQDSKTKKNTLFIQDDELQDLIDKSVGVDTHSVESVGAVQQYVLDHAMMYPYVWTSCNYIHVNSITNARLEAGITFLPQFSEYGDDFSRTV